MSNMQISNQQAFSPRAIVQRLLPTLIFSALIPYLVYRVGTEDYHLTAVNALLLAAISPALNALVTFVLRRQLNILGLFALVGITAKISSALLFHDPHLVLISDSLLSGVYGLLLLGSVLIGKPALVVLVTSMYAKSPEQGARLRQSLQTSDAHRRMQILTAMWGVGLLLLFAISVVLTYTFPIATVVLIRPLIDYGVIAVLLAGTIAFRYALAGKREQSAPADVT